MRAMWRIGRSRLRLRGAAALVLAVVAIGAVAAEPLRTAPVLYREVDRQLVADGVVEAVRQSTVAAQVSGRVVDIRFDVGDVVKKGEVIVRIDERELAEALASAQAQVAQAQAVFNNAKVQYERSRELFNQKFVSQAALDKALADYRSAEAQLAAATAAAGQAETVKGHATIVAPYGGVVAARHVQLGETVLPGTPLMTGFDPKDLRVVADVPQLSVPEVSASRGTVVEFPDLGAKLAAGPVTVLPAADAKTHTTRVRVALPRYVAGTYPGMYARVAFAIGRVRKLLIPATAVVRRAEVSAVYVVTPQGAVELRQLRLGEAVGDAEVKVLAGLKTSEAVALEPFATAAAKSAAAR